MFLNVWKNLRGYVEIELKGFAVERFISMAAHSGIYIWDVTRGGANVRMKVSVKSFWRLKPCAKKTGTKIRIVGRHGLPFIMRRYRKRKFLALGALFFIAALYALSCFVWLIEVEGTERLNKNEIIAFLAENGLKIGSLKMGVSDKEYEKLLIESFGDIAWVDLEKKGTQITVRIAETIPAVEIPDRSSPANIVAEREGLIVSIATSAGTPMVKAGDVVSKGDVLASAETLIGTPDTGYYKEYVHAEAEVKAKMYYNLSIDVELVYFEKKYTGNVMSNYSIIIFDNEIGVFTRSVPYLNYDAVAKGNRLNFGKNYPLPLELVKVEVSEFINVKRERTVEEAKELGETLIGRRILREFDAAAEIIGVELTFSVYQDHVQVDALVATIESLGVSEIITADE